MMVLNKFVTKYFDLLQDKKCGFLYLLIGYLVSWAVVWIALSVLSLCAVTSAGVTDFSGPSNVLAPLFTFILVLFMGLPLPLTILHQSSSLTGEELGEALFARLGLGAWMCLLFGSLGLAMAWEFGILGGTLWLKFHATALLVANNNFRGVCFLLWVTLATLCLICMKLAKPIFVFSVLIWWLFNYQLNRLVAGGSVAAYFPTEFLVLIVCSWTFYLFVFLWISEEFRQAVWYAFKSERQYMIAVYLLVSIIFTLLSLYDVWPKLVLDLWAPFSYVLLMFADVLSSAISSFGGRFWLFKHWFWQMFFNTGPRWVLQALGEYGIGVARQREQEGFVPEAPAPVAVDPDADSKALAELNVGAARAGIPGFTWFGSASLEPKPVQIENVAKQRVDSRFWARYSSRMSWFSFSLGDEVVSRGSRAEAFLRAGYSDVYLGRAGACRQTGFVPPAVWSMNIREFGAPFGPVSRGHAAGFYRPLSLRADRLQCLLSSKYGAHSPWLHARAILGSRG